MMNRNVLRVTFALAAAPPLMITTARADAPNYFISDSHLGTSNTSNNQLGQAVFYSGKYNRTYGLYMSDRLMGKITSYDIGQWARPAVLNLTILRGEHSIYDCHSIVAAVAAAHNTPLRWKNLSAQGAHGNQRLALTLRVEAISDGSFQ